VDVSRHVHTTHRSYSIEDVAKMISGAANKSCQPDTAPTWLAVKQFNARLLTIIIIVA